MHFHEVGLEIPRLKLVLVRLIDPPAGNQMKDAHQRSKVAMKGNQAEIVLRQVNTDQGLFYPKVRNVQF